MIPQPITTDLVPVNREQKRMFYNELEKIAPKIKEVEDSFIELLFSDDSRTYQELYVSHLDWYTNNVKWILAFVRPKVFKINKTYFSQMFAPLETSKEESSILSAHLVRK